MEGQEDQREMKELGGSPLSLSSLPGPPGIPSGSSRGKRARGPGDGAAGAIAGGGVREGAEAPPHLLSPIVGTLGAQEPKTPKKRLQRAPIRPWAPWNSLQVS